MLTSDKHHWHRFSAAYAEALTRLGPVTRILEFGVLRGDSVRWLRACYPAAEIHAADILAADAVWPQDPQIHYHRLDQGDPAALTDLFTRLGPGLDLIIEDGSHQPVHQALCLRRGLPQLRRGGLYILEDIHTSHPSHPLAQAVAGAAREAGRRVEANALTLLLALQHLKDSGLPLSDDSQTALSSPTFFAAADVRAIFEALHAITLFRRASLPLSCWSCGSAAFDYPALRCRCGTDLYAEADSMTALLTRA